MTTTTNLNPHGFATVQGAGSAVRAIAAVGSTAATTAKSFGALLAGGPGAAASIAGSGAAGGDLGGIADLTELIQSQAQVQREQQAFTMQTNLSKTEHESRMAAVRNLRP